MTAKTFTLTLGALLAGVLLAPATARAQTEAAVRDHVKQGQKVSITDEQGREFNGRITSLADGALTIAVDKTSSDIPYPQIVTINRPHDGLGNGALIGFGVGATLGLLSMASEEQSCDSMSFFGCWNPGAGDYAAVTAIIGGMGAAIGAGVDALIHRNPSLYRRGNTRITMTPAIAPGKRAALLAVSW